MTDDANPDEPNGPQVLAQFLRDWTALWREELQDQRRDPETSGPIAGMPGNARAADPAAAMELWGSALTVWAETLGTSSLDGPGDRSGPARSAAAAAAPDPRDAAIERLTRRVDECEARLAKLEAPRRRRG